MGRAHHRGTLRRPRTLPVASRYRRRMSWRVPGDSARQPGLAHADRRRIDRPRIIRQHNEVGVLARRQRPGHVVAVGLPGRVNTPGRRPAFSHASRAASSWAVVIRADSRPEAVRPCRMSSSLAPKSAPVAASCTLVIPGPAHPRARRLRRAARPRPASRATGQGPACPDGSHSTQPGTDRLSGTWLVIAAPPSPLADQSSRPYHNGNLEATLRTTEPSSGGRLDEVSTCACPVNRTARCQLNGGQGRAAPATGVRWVVRRSGDGGCFRRWRAGRRGWGLCLRPGRAAFGPSFGIALVMRGPASRARKGVESSPC